MRPTYLCLFDIGRCFLGRLNLTVLEQTEDIPPFEKVLDLKEENLPQGMAAFSVGYELYLVGGEGVKSPKTPLFNSTLYKLQRTDSFSFKPVRLSSSESGKPYPMIAQIDGKVYVLGTRSKLYYCAPPSPAFEVYDPLKDTWETLPDPPCYYSKDACLVSSFNAFRNFIIMYSSGGCSVYDVDTNKWNSWRSSPLDEKYFLGCRPFECGAIVTYGNIMIAFNNMHGLVVYFPDFNSSTVSFETLEQLNNVVSIEDEEAGGSVHHLGNGKMCSVCFKSTDEFYWAVSVAIFQVNISSNMDRRRGKCAVTTDLLRHHIFKAGNEAQYWIFVDAFIMSEGLGKRGLECENPGKSSKRTMTVLGVHSQ